jgi:rod shape determining protein RodA
MPLLGLQFNIWRKFDWLLIAAVLVLVSISLSAVYSLDLSRGETLIFFPTQAIAFALGLILLLVTGFLRASIYRQGAKLIYLFSLLSLVVVLFFGQTVRGTTGWFKFGSFSFQPAELAKVALIIFGAWWISRQSRRFERSQFVVSSGFFTFLLAALSMLQPDLGSALVLGGIWFGMLFITGTKRRFIFGLLGVFFAVAVLGWFFFLKDYQKDRLLTFLDSGRDPLGAGYNVTQSIIAIGAGQFLGRGLGFGSQSQLHFLPEAQTDFVFSVIAEELGFLGVLVLLGLYFLILWRLLNLAQKVNDDFCAHLILGILLLFLVQLIVNIGGAIGFLPVTGVTLPFVSYGGSSLMINLLLIGIAQSAARG